MNCSSLDNVVLPSSLKEIGGSAFSNCHGLSSLTVSEGTETIGSFAFSSCDSLTRVKIPATVSNIGSGAFAACSTLTEVYFKGDAPKNSDYIFDPNDAVTSYYTVGTKGWGYGDMFGGRPAVPWYPIVPTDDGTFGIQSQRFGFTIANVFSSNLVVVIEASSELAGNGWVPVWTNKLSERWLPDFSYLVRHGWDTNQFVGFSSTFTDPHWTNGGGRFYRLRMP